MVTNIRCLVLVALCLYVAYGNEVKAETKEKRFILFWPIVAKEITNNIMTPLLSSAIHPDCVQCKCLNVCTAPWYLGVSDKDICGTQVWNSINCAGVTQTPSTTTVAPVTAVANGILFTQKPTPKTTVKSCDRMCTIGSMARGQPMSSNITSMCFSGNRSGNEALPTVCCGLQSVSQWKMGAKVTDACNSGDITYSPVAAFVNGAYVPGSAGILVECKTNTFQLASQTCNKGPALADVTTHQGAYYVIEQL